MNEIRKNEVTSEVTKETKDVSSEKGACKREGKVCEGCVCKHRMFKDCPIEEDK